MEFNLKIENDRLTSAERLFASSGSCGVYKCVFDIFSGFGSLVWFCVFRRDDNAYVKLIENGECVVPYEVLDDTGTVEIGCYATDGAENDTKRLSTNYISVTVEEGAYCMADSPEPASADVWERMTVNSVPKIGENENWYLYDITKSEYTDTGKPSRGVQGVQGIQGERGPQGVQGIQGEKGEKGDTGERGEKGDKPIRGTDYWTEEDKAAICADLDEKISAKAEQSYVDEIESGFRAEFEVDEAKIQSLEGTASSLVNDTQELKTDVDAAKSALNVHDSRLDSLTITAGTAAVGVEDLNSDMADLKSKSIPHTTASADGGMLTVTDSLAGEKLKGLKIYGGDTDSALAMSIYITGKNLIPLDQYKKSSFTANGITWKTNDDGTITANGTATSFTTLIFLSGYYNTYLPPGTYYLSGSPKGGSYDTHRIAFQLGSGNTYDITGSEVYDSGNGVLAKAPNGIRSIYAKITIGSGATCNNLTFKPQLEIGSVKTEFEPAKKNVATVTSSVPINAGSYLDASEKAIVTGDGKTTVTVGGELKTVESSMNNIFTDLGTTGVYPSKIEAEYYQDINKVITELKNAVLAQGADV